jgi:hypothetical protein
MYRDEAPDNLDLFVGGILETTFDGPGPLFLLDFLFCSAILSQNCYSTIFCNINYGNLQYVVLNEISIFLLKKLQ